MNGYRYRSTTGSLFGLAAKVLVATVALSLLSSLLDDLLVTIAGVSVLVMFLTIWVRWRVFRHRGW